MESDAPAYAEQEQYEERDDARALQVDVAAEAAEDAVVVERPTELETVSVWPTQDLQASQPDDDAPVMHEQGESWESEEPAEERVEYASSAAAEETPAESSVEEPAVPGRTGASSIADGISLPGTTRLRRRHLRSQPRRSLPRRSPSCT